MPKVKHPLQSALSTLAILMSFFMLLSLIVFFITHQPLFQNTKTVGSWIIGLLPSVGVIAFLGKKIKSGIQTHGSLSQSIRYLLIGEPLIHAMLWLFIVFQTCIFCYALPVYFVQLQLSGEPDETELDWKAVRQVCLIKNQTPYPLKRISGKPIVYSSERFLSRGESVLIQVEAKGYASTSQALAWPAFVILKVFSGIQSKIELRKAPPVRIQIRAVNPASAQIHFASPVDSQFTGYGVIEIDTGKRVEIHVSSPRHQPWDTVFSADGNLNRDLRLSRIPERVVFRGFQQMGDIEYNRMALSITDMQGKLIRQGRSGESIEIFPGTYRLKMVKILRPEPPLSAVVDETVTISVGDTEKVFRAVLEGHE